MYKILMSIFLIGACSHLSAQITIGFPSPDSTFAKLGKDGTQTLTVKLNVRGIPTNEKIKIAVSRSDEDGTAPIKSWRIVSPVELELDAESNEVQYIVIELTADERIKAPVYACLKLEATHVAPDTIVAELTHIVKISPEAPQKTPVEKKLDKILAKLDENELDTIGRFIFFKHPNGEVDIPVWRYKKKKKQYVMLTKLINRFRTSKMEKTGERVTLDKVIINTKEGIILDIQAISIHNQTFTNRHAPIPINQFNETDTKLGYLDPNGSLMHISTADFIRWERFQNFAPEDSRFSLNSDENIKYLSKGSGLNQAFDFKLFTDLTGVFGNKPNGITQTEMFGKIPLNSRNAYVNNSFLWFYYIKTNLCLSKFDSKFSYQNLENTDRQQLLQTSWLNFDFATNIASFWLTKKTTNWFYLDAGIGLNVTRARTNETGTADTVQVLQPYVFVEPVFSFKSSNNLGIYFIPRIQIQKAQNLEGVLHKTHTIFRPQITIYWNPKNVPSSRVFLRGMYYYDFDLKAKPFYQLQVGYSILLSEIINSKKIR